MERSRGVTIFAVLCLIWAVIELMQSLSFPNKTPLVSSMFTIEILLSIITGIGALLLREWARKTIIIYAIVSIVIVIIFHDGLLNLYRSRITTTDADVKALTSSFVIPMLVIARVLWRICIIFFFTRPNVKEQFN
jgi:hypothetical protein